MIALELHNITFSSAGLEMDIDLVKVSTTQCLISQSRLTNLYQHYPYVPKKSEIEGKPREEIREKISPPLDLAVVSELVVGAHSKGLAPSPVTLFRYLCHSFLKGLENESEGMRG